MKLKIAGGYGEHGRNCFFVDRGEHGFLVDCGIMADESEDRFPHLLSDDIKRIRYVFLTHSHADHTGALPWLTDNGFGGKVVASKHTLEQLPFKLKNTLSLEQICNHERRGSIGDISIQYGRSGHCIGSVWYHFQLENRSVLFSGDYTEDTQMYAFDMIRGRKADLAVLDCAYGYDAIDYQNCCKLLIEKIKELKEVYQTIVFPVPRYGRGLELLKLFEDKFPEFHLYGDAHFINQTAHLSMAENWLKKQARSFEFHVSLYNSNHDADIVFISDPQLRSPQSQRIVKQLLERNSLAVMTGSVETGTLSDELIKQGKMQFVRYHVHLNYTQYMNLKEQNCFDRTIPYHTAEISGEREFRI